MAVGLCSAVPRAGGPAASRPEVEPSEGGSPRPGPPVPPTPLPPVAAMGDGALAASGGCVCSTRRGAGFPGRRAGHCPLCPPPAARLAKTLPPHPPGRIPSVTETGLSSAERTSNVARRFSQNLQPPLLASSPAHHLQFHGAAAHHPPPSPPPPPAGSPASCCSRAGCSTAPPPPPLPPHVSGAPYTSA